MATTIDNECVGCPAELGCMGSSCPYIAVKHFYCDKCGEELDDDSHYYDGEEDLCEVCLMDKYRYTSNGGDDR